MFRTAILRCSFSAVRAAARIPMPRAASRAGLLPSSRVFAPATIPSIQGLLSARMYSAGLALNKEVVEGRILSLLRGFDKVNTDKLSPVAHFTNDLGLDSLDTVEVVMAIEEEFSIEIPDKDADAIHSVGNAVEYILNQPDAV